MYSSNLKVFDRFKYLLASFLLFCCIGLPSVSVSQSIRSSTQIVDTLPNGIRYYIKSNHQPAKRAFLWLAVKAGSIQEDEDQLGFAHFFEHMAFNGTKNFPSNALIDVVEKSGMSFGADLNAYTSFDETVYQLTMPTDDPVLLNQGLQIIDDWASGRVLNDSLEVVGERGVILGEWRARLPDTASARFQRESLERIFGKGSRYVDRLPIGDPELIKNAQPAELKRYYEDWYRPDLMAVIVVGDFDINEMEKQIIDRFGDIPVPDNPREFDHPVVEKSATTTVHLIKDNVQPRIDFTWPLKPFESDPKLAMKEFLLERITMPYLNRIATAMSKRERRPFMAAQASRSQEYPIQTGDKLIMSVVAVPDSIVYGFSSLVGELERVAQHGLPDDVMKREKAALLRSFEQYADGSVAIPSRTIANQYLQHYLSDKGHLWSPAEALELVKEILPGITGKDVAEFASRWRSEANRTVSVYIPKFSTLRFITEEDINKLLDSVSTAQLASQSPYLNTATNGNNALSASAKPGSVKEKQVFKEADVSTFTLSNGTKVVVKPTDANPDEVILYAHSDGGHSLLPDSLFFASGRLVTMLMTSAGGLGGKTHDELSDDLSATGVREFRIDLNAFNEEMMVRGSPRELETMFQLMHLQFTDPTIDTTALAEWRRTGGRTLRISQNDRIAGQLSGNHRRLSPPQAVNVSFMDLDQAMRVYKDRFGDASDFTFFIVGAVEPETVKPLLEKYIANLPSTNREARETPKSFNIRNPTSRSVNSMEHPNQSPERAQMGLSFRGDLPVVSDEMSAVDVSHERMKIQAMSIILSRRLRNRLREEMAVTYSVGAPATFYETPESRYFINISLLTAPDMIDTSTSVVWNEIKEMYKEGPTEEELSIAYTIMTRRFENAGQSNDWWVSRLVASEEDGEHFPETAILPPVKFTSEEIREAAVKYMPESIYAQQTIKPTKENIEKNKKKDEKKEEDKEEK